jgi:hypothetical protein
MNDITLDAARDLLGDIAARSKLAREGVLLATFAGFDADGQFLVTLSEDLQRVHALSTVRLMDGDTGGRVIIAFEKGNTRRPVIIGRLVEQPAAPSSINLDGERLVLKAEREIELRCGEASILLTRAGKVLIRGAHIVSRSRGANKVKGAFIELN